MKLMRKELQSQDLPVNPMQRRERSRWVTWLLCMIERSPVEEEDEVDVWSVRGLKRLAENCTDCPTFPKVLQVAVNQAGVIW